MKNKLRLLILLLLANVIAIQAQEKQEVQILFKLGSADISDNVSSLDTVVRLINNYQIDSLITIQKVVISSYTSPEGGSEHNHNLASQRIASVLKYLNSRISLPDSYYEVNGVGAAWDNLKSIVAESGMEYADEVIDIIDNVPEETWCRVNQTDEWLTLTDSRNKHLMDLALGHPYHYMQRELFPLMRYTSVIIYFTREDHPLQEEEEVVDTLPVVEEVIEEVVEPVCEEQPILQEREKLPIALKTNLAYLGVGVANLGVEVALSDKLSLDIPIVYSPYTIARSWNLRILDIQPELRYWLDESLKGHFFGVHLHGGYYNVAIGDKTRYQDTDGDSPFYGFGVSYGYALEFGKRWGASFTAGLGYARFDSDLFYNTDNGTIFGNKVVDYCGITKIGVNLIYKIR